MRALKIFGVISLISSVIVILIAIGLVGFLVARQDMFLYHPRPYADHDLNRWEPSVERVTYDVEGEQHTAFLWRPEEAQELTTLWIFFHGNASRALEWVPRLEAVTNPNVGVLLIDYPSYGLNPGKPTPASIQESATALEKMLTSHLGEGYASIQSVNLLGYSLGAAVAAEFARDREADTLVMLAPFTSTADMADHMMGFPWKYFLRHDFDNRKSLEAIILQEAPPKMLIFHGANDTLIPDSMSKDLNRLAPDLIELTILQQGTHDNLPDLVWSDIVELINESAP